MITKSTKMKLLTLLLLLVVPFSSSVWAKTLSIDDVRKLALEFNRTYLAAQEEVIKAESEIMIARSNGLPDITITGRYNRNIKQPTFFFNDDSGEVVEFRSGFKNDFGAGISLRQSIWSGNRVWNAYKIAKLYQKLALASEKQVKAEVIKNAEDMFYLAILSSSNLKALNKALEAVSHNLAVVEKLHDKGMVSEFELLRAKVERGNILPLILEAESQMNLSYKRLKSYLGMNLEDEISLNEPTDDINLANLSNMNELIDKALSNRPEIHQAEYMKEMTRRAVSIVKADYWPKIEAVSSYDWSSQSDRVTLSDNKVTTWTAGINLTFPIFSGGETKGNVKNYKAEYRQAQIAYNEVKDAIRLEVDASYNQLIKAHKSVEVQSETIAQAEEGLRIANLRYESGIGTQLEVLSAQSALTDARNAMARSKFMFRQAKAELKKVTTVDLG